MAGILGGTNAFNFINFVAAVVTLVGKLSENILKNSLQTRQLSVLNTLDTLLTAIFPFSEHQ